jgi:hypothetical protein
MRSLAQGFAKPASRARAVARRGICDGAIACAVRESARYRDRGTPAECSAGLRLAIERGWLVMHESGTFVKFTQAGADLFA